MKVFKQRDSDIDSFSVDDVMISEDKSRAIVRYSVTFAYDSGESLVTSQETEWKYVDGTWYRIIKAANVQATSALSYRE